MTDDTSTEAAGDAAGGPVAPVLERSAPKGPPVVLRQVPPPSAEERRARSDALERALKHGAAPYRDAKGQARYVFFREANNAPVEPWRRDPRARRGYRKVQQARKAAGQLAGHPGDHIEIAKRLGVIHHREGSDIEGAAARGLYEAIWRYEHVYDSFTVPRRFGLDIIETGRIAAVAEEEGRRLRADDPTARGGFWVRDRKNNGLIYVVPNADPEMDKLDSETSSYPDESSPEASVPVSSQGDDVGVGRTDIPVAPEEVQGKLASSQATVDPPVAGGSPSTLNYPNIPLPLLQPTWVDSGAVTHKGLKPPVINMEQDRIRNILANEPARFEIADSPAANGDEPGYADHGYGYWAIWVHQDVIEREAKRQGVDPDLVKAIVYVESAQGWYGYPVEMLRLAKTIFPMNINPTTWAGLIGENADFYDPITNIRAGVILIRRVLERVEDPTVAKVASPFKFTGREQVSEYGARVAQVYATRAWRKRPLPQIYPESDKASDWEPEYDGYRRRREALKERLSEEENSENGSDAPIVGPMAP